MMKRIIFALCGVLAVSVSPVVFSGNAEAQSRCSDVHIMFARGSGQDVSDDDSDIFYDSVSKKFDKVGISYHFHELQPSEYPAVSVGVDDSDQIGRSIGAIVTGGEGYAYGKSVDQGARSMADYVKKTLASCKGAKFVLGGYSQGAQVVGEALHLLKNDQQARDSIVFAALFGDPKLHLPEGARRTVIVKDRKRKEVPPFACLGMNLSDWRRDPIACVTYKGSLGARKNYLPDYATKKTGLWCVKGDIVCNGMGRGNSIAPHFNYKGTGQAIEKASQEILARMLPHVDKDIAKKIEHYRIGREVKNNHIDIAFVLDISGSMQEEIDGMKRFIRTSADKIKKLNGRVALTVFRNHCDSPPASVMTTLSEDVTNLNKALDHVRVDGGCDETEGSLHALKLTLDTLNWREGATKAAILLTDEPPALPDRTDGSTPQSVARRALEIDPVNVYPVVSDGYEDRYQELADLTSGQVITANTTESALEIVFEKLKTRPEPFLPLTHYQAMAGETITFTVADSMRHGDHKITAYEWDVNGDGVIDATTQEPILKHAYAMAFDGYMSVRARADNGTIGSSSAQVTVYQQADALPTVPEKPVNLTFARKGDMVELDWRLANGAAAPAMWRVSVGDVPVAEVDHTNGRLWLQLKDVPKDADMNVTVVAVSSEGTESDPAELTITKVAPPSPQSPAPRPPTASSEKACPYTYKLGRITFYCKYKTLRFFSAEITIRTWHVRW